MIELTHILNPIDFLSCLMCLNLIFIAFYQQFFPKDKQAIKIGSWLEEIIEYSSFGYKADDLGITDEKIANE